MTKKIKEKNKVIVILLIVIIAIVSMMILPKILHQNVLEQSELRLVVYKEDGTNFGSAVIYQSDKTYYYALTNDHVIDSYTSISAIDYENNRYTVEVVDSDASFDLAVIKIEKNIKLKEIEFAESFSVFDEVIAVGYPSSVYKETDGVVTTYEAIDYDIEFAVIVHSASISKGSSGGALVNVDHELIGINFAGYFDNNTLTESYAIPINQVRTYLEGIS
jgi:serine protease Do